MKLGCSIGARPLVAVLAGSLGFVACTEADVEVEYGRAILEIAPATHNATFVGSDLSTQLSPGEKRAVRMTFTNTGVSAPTDNWVVGTHYLRSTNIPLGNWGITNMPLSAGTAVGNNTDVYFRVTVPGPNPNRRFSGPDVRQLPRLRPGRLFRPNRGGHGDQCRFRQYSTVGLLRDRRDVAGLHASGRVPRYQHRGPKHRLRDLDTGELLLPLGG
jgi:hypothetical protein